MSAVQHERVFLDAVTAAVQALADEVLMCSTPATPLGTRPTRFLNGHPMADEEPVRLEQFQDGNDIVAVVAERVAQYAERVPRPRRLSWFEMPGATALKSLDTRSTGIAVTFSAAFETVEKPATALAEVKSIREPDMDIVHKLEGLRGLAMEGKIVAFGICYITDRRKAVTGWQGTDQGALHSLHGAAALLVHRIGASAVDNEEPPEN